MDSKQSPANTTHHIDSVDSIVSLEKVSKSFGPVTVIDEVSLHVRPGQVHALLGENGAGKSTLIKMLSGVYQPDEGRIIVDGVPTTLPNTKAAEAKGIATIHQELNLVPTLSVAENLLLGRTPSRWGLVNRREMRQRAQKALELIGVDVDLDSPVGSLGIARQQLVEIAKALTLNARVLILDEPTAALTGAEIEKLFSVVRDLKSKGVGMVFISHHLDEIAEIADTVSVLRDGQFIAEVPATTPEAELVKLMVGRDIDDQYPRTPSLEDTKDEPLLEVKGLHNHGSFSGITFSVMPGEVVGIAGLVGAGRTEVLRAIAGADRYDSGEITVGGEVVPNGSIKAAIKAGIGHVPEDRKSQGLILDAPVVDNLGLATLSTTSKRGLADLKGQRSRGKDVAERLKIRMASIDSHVRNLSGGNQQKVVFGRWVLAGSNVLLLDEPTRGVDVGAKIEIYSIINDITERGGAVVMVSSDLPEVLGMSDRLLVMSGGQIVGELDPQTASQDDVMSLAVKNTDSAVENSTLTAVEKAPEQRTVSVAQGKDS
ncbi:sugar ABC transporter ATP-binding protein [Corynebacterium sp. TAE3-ERU2]|uniref:sugar ABC transporter ATP-binding protein n=1 Tax=Corynebacterium sp. TAE3-ERU2 TaxID=2849497 RepID=UPI001C4575BE|nr:sugar ABC transporter ATP-binding protein [Corynebacterium sp. TAE3-ERU2]MBV7302406.1 sugar ABC transporter ATP-binding protein [Corynebacterium sp. TAE3-ERU2]